jgi:hypothetical protein
MGNVANCTQYWHEGTDVLLEASLAGCANKPTNHFSVRKVQSQASVHLSWQATAGVLVCKHVG